MSLVFFIISFLLFFNWTSSSEYGTNDIKRTRANSRSVSFGFLGKIGDFFSINYPTQITETTNLESKRGIKRKADDLNNDFDRIFAKWNKRPPDLDCSWAPKVPSDRRLDHTKLRIASYNAEWLFLFGGSGSIRCPGNSCPWDNFSKARDHIVETVELLKKLDADIIHLNEIEDCRILRILMDLLPSNHGYRAYFVHGTDNMTGQNVGILTRIDPSSDLIRTEDRIKYPIPGSKCGVDSSYTSYSRGQRRSGTMGLSKHYLTTFRIGDLNIIWAGAHFIAQPNNVDRCVRREAQASLLANFIESHANGSEVIITGDFNDHDDEVMGANNAAPISSVLRILKNTDLGLQSTASFINDPLSRYTSWHDVNDNCLDDGPHEHSMIDHVLVSPRLAERITSVWMDHNKTVSCQSRTSDHWPLIIDLDLSENK